MATQNSARASVVPSHGVGRITPWQPGQSGNPGGRPMGMREVREAARKLCHESVTALGRIVTETVIDESGIEHNAHEGKVVVAAVQTILTWAYGKPPEYDPREDRPSVGINLAVLSAKEKRGLLDMLRKGLLVGDEPEAEAGPVVEVKAADEPGAL